jgi:hypothetical protein
MGFETIKSSLAQAQGGNLSGLEQRPTGKHPQSIVRSSDGPYMKLV